MRGEFSGEWGPQDLRRPGRVAARQAHDTPQMFQDVSRDVSHGGLAGAVQPPPWQGAHAAPDPRACLRALRPGRTPAGIAAALLISVVGWAATADLIWVMLGGRPHWGTLNRLAELGARAWGDPLPGAIACLMIVCGVALVAHALTPGRPRLVPLETRDPLLALGLTRSGLRRTLAAAVRAVDGVDGVHVGLRGRRVEITVRAAARRTGEVLPRVGDAVGGTLVRLRADHNRQVVVRLRPGRGRP